jgi:hypothetical protein
MRCGGTAESMHRKEANGQLIEHGGEQAAYRPFLGPDVDPMGLLIPEVAAIRLRDTFGIFVGIGPCWDPLKLACLVHDPWPWNDALEATPVEQFDNSRGVTPKPVIPIVIRQKTSVNAEVSDLGRRTDGDRQ